VCYILFNVIRGVRRATCRDDMLNDYVIVILTDEAGEEVFDRLVYFPGQERERVEHRVNMLSSIGYKTRSVEMPLEHFDPNRKCDVFLAYAIAYGISYNLALLGRECILIASEQNWDIELQNRHHLAENGKNMIQFALREPAKAQELWSCLIRTDGRNCAASAHEKNHDK
jgi:hypothetical protein